MSIFSGPSSERIPSDLGQGRVISRACSGGFHARCFWNECNKSDCDCHTEYLDEEDVEPAATAASKIPLLTSSALAKLLLVAVSLVVSVAAGEFLLRLAMPPPIHWRYHQERYLYDPQIAIKLARNQRAFTHDKPVEINSGGIRDSEYSDTAPAGVTRVVALGD